MPSDPNVVPNEPKPNSTQKKPKQNERSEPFKAPSIFVYLGLCAAVFIAYGLLLKSDFAWSNYDLVDRSGYDANTTITDIWSIESIKRGYALTHTTYWFESKLPLATAISHRLINLSLHLAATIALLRLLAAMRIRGCTPAAYVFAMHPSCMQALFWVGYRDILICTVLLLMAAYFGIRNRGKRDFIALCSLSALACFTHPSALGFPIVMCLLILYYERENNWHNFNRALPLYCISLFIAVWMSSVPPIIPPYDFEFLSFVHEVRHAGQNLVFFMRQTLFPTELQLFYPYQESTEQSMSIGVTLLPFAILLPFLIIAFALFQTKIGRAALLGVFGYLILLMPSLVAVGYAFDTSIAHEDHGLYVALPIIIAIAIPSIRKLIRKIDNIGNLAWLICLFAILAIEGIISVSQAQALSNPVKMWETLNRQWPNTSIPESVKLDYIAEGRIKKINHEQVISLLVIVLEEHPDNLDRRMQLARLYEQANQFSNALREYRRALREGASDLEFMQESVEIFTRAGLKWEADNVRQRIADPNFILNLDQETTNNTQQENDTE